MAKRDSKQALHVSYEWQVCPFEDVDDKLIEMRKAGWHPVSHSIWYDVRGGITMASFIFRKKIEPISEKRKADVMDMIRAMVDGSK